MRAAVFIVLLALGATQVDVAREETDGASNFATFVPLSPLVSPASLPPAASHVPHNASASAAVNASAAPAPAAPHVVGDGEPTGSKEDAELRRAFNDGLTNAAGSLLVGLEEAPAAVGEAGSVEVETERENEGDAVSEQHRTNFASNAAGAVIMSANPEMTGVTSLLGDDSDHYALSRCDVKKFVILGLSEDVLVDTLILFNEEKYSSAVNHFKVLGAQKYPASEWIVLGNFSAENKLGAQSFPIAVRSWVRYIKVNWLSHYGHEFYCTWTRIRVHGSTLLEDLQEQVFTSEAEVAAAKQQIHLEAAARAAATPVPPAVPLASAAPLLALAAAEVPHGGESAVALTAGAASTTSGNATGGELAAGSADAALELYGAVETSASARPSTVSNSTASPPPPSASSTATKASDATADPVPANATGSASATVSPHADKVEPAAPAAVATVATSAAPAALTTTAPSSVPEEGEGPGQKLAHANASTIAVAAATPSAAARAEATTAEGVPAEAPVAREPSPPPVEPMAGVEDRIEHPSDAAPVEGEHGRNGTGLLDGEGGGAHDAGHGPSDETGGELTEQEVSALALVEGAGPAGVLGPLPDSTTPLLLLDDTAASLLLANAAAMVVEEAQAVAALHSVTLPKLSGDAAASAGPASSGGGGRGAGGAPVTTNVFKTLTRKLKDLEIDNSLIHGYLSDMHSRYTGAAGALARSSASVRSGLSALKEEVAGCNVLLGHVGPSGVSALRDAAAVAVALGALEAGMTRLERALDSTTRALLRHLREEGVDVSPRAEGGILRHDEEGEEGGEEEGKGLVRLGDLPQRAGPREGSRHAPNPAPVTEECLPGGGGGGSAPLPASPPLLTSAFDAEVLIALREEVAKAARTAAVAARLAAAAVGLGAALLAVAIGVVMTRKAVLVDGPLRNAEWFPAPAPLKQPPSPAAAPVLALMPTSTLRPSSSEAEVELCGSPLAPPRLCPVGSSETRHAPQDGEGEAPAMDEVPASEASPPATGSAADGSVCALDGDAATRDLGQPAVDERRRSVHQLPPHH
jgi:hypothetical protein